MEHMKHRQLWADILLLLVTLIWGSTFVMVKDAVSSYPVFPFLAIRFGLATLALLAIGWKRLPSLGWKGAAAGALIGLCLLAGYAFQTLGLQYTSASKTGFITGLSVVLVPLLATLLLRQMPGIESIIGVCLATVGLALLTLDQGLAVARGDLLVLLCALSFALHIVAVSHFAPKLDPLALTTVQVATVSVVSGAISLFTVRPWPTPSPSAWFAAGFTGILATAVAFGLQTAMQRFTTPTHTALIFAGEPVFAAVFGVLLAGDLMTGQNVAGGVLIVVGTIVSEINWSQRTAKILSRFLSPQYVAAPLLLVLGLADPVSWKRGLIWAAGVGLFSITLPLAAFYRALKRGGISDWHVTRREERMQVSLLLPTVAALVLPLAAMVALKGPRLLLIGFASGLILSLFNIMVTWRWKISQHVSTVAVSTTLITSTLGLGASPVLLLIPLVAWARVKVGAHTVMQTVAGGLAGVAVSILTTRFLGI